VRPTEWSGDHLGGREANCGPTISRPLTELLKKAVPFVWNSVSDAAFQ